MPDSIDQSVSSALTSRFVDAVKYAVGLHLDQSRKGSGVPYAGHLLGVCSLVLEAGGSEDEAIAALFHDAGEDRGGEAQLVEIRERFGENVGEIVHACSDSLLQDKPDWKMRKEEYLAHLDGQPESVLLVSLADKLFNARAILRDYRSVGESLWDRFFAGRDGVLWYYRSLSDSFTRIVPGNRMTGELAEVVAQLERLVAERSIGSPSQAGTQRQLATAVSSDPTPGACPLKEIDDLFAGVASRVGAEQPASVASTWSDDKTAAVNNMMRLIGASKLDHTLTRDGSVVVPAKAGTTDVVLDARQLRGQEWIHAFIVVLIDLPDTPEVAVRVDEFLREGNQYYGAKFLRLGPELEAIADIPCEGLDTPLLLAVMRRLLAVVEDAATDIEKIAAGRRPGGVFPSLGWPVRRPLQL